MKKSTAKLIIMKGLLLNLREVIIILILFGILISLITVILFLILCVYIIIAFIRRRPLPNKLLIATLSGVILVSSITLYEMYFFTSSEIDRNPPKRGLDL